MQQNFHPNADNLESIIMNQLSSNMERATSLSQRFAEHAGHKTLRNLSDPSRSASPSLMDWIRDLWGRLGSPFSREGFSLMPVTIAPFGRRRAMNNSGRRW